MNRAEVRALAEKDVKTKALLVIEVLSFGDIKLNENQYSELVYKFSHCALSKGCSSCDHNDWEKELDEWFNKMLDMNLI